MKKILTIILITIISLTIFSEISYAAGTIKVTVTEPIPGANCHIKSDGNGGSASQGSTLMYECNIQSGMGSVVIMLGKIIKYFTFIAALGTVLFIVINGIMYSMGGMDPSMKDDAKKRIIATLSGLILLLLSGVILNMIAPWVYK